jgi:hypothetical protein
MISVYLFAMLLSVCLFNMLSVCLFAMLSVCLFAVYLPDCCLSACLPCCCLPVLQKKTADRTKHLFA